MAAVVREFFRIVLDEDNYIAFGERDLGQIGKDILAVKSALGLVTSPTTIQAANEDNSIGESDGWFDCRTGRVISAREGATFDAAMEVAVMKFQLENQYLILSYLFNKYGVRNFLKTIEEGMDFFDGIGNPQDGAAATGEDERWYGERRNQVKIPGRAALENLLKEITAIETLFQNEFGRVGEATLAVLHGWLPYTEFRNNSYNVENPPETPDYRYPYPVDFKPIIEVAPIQLYKMLAEKIIRPDWERFENIIQIISEAAMVEAEQEQQIHDIMGWSGGYFTSRGTSWYGGEAGSSPGRDHEGEEEGVVRLDGTMGLLQAYSATPTGHTSFLKEAKEHDEIEYGLVLYKPYAASYESPLYIGSKDVIDNIDLDEYSSELLSPEARAEFVERAFFPNPYTDPDPFVINAEKIGFFARTRFTFNNLPSLDAQTIANLEDAALTRILEFYEKPEIWFIDKDSPATVLNYFTIEDVENRPQPSHSGQFSTGQDWVLTTMEVISNENVPEGSVQHYSTISGQNENLPLIKFIEYQEPTLRPGDVYRAFFEISKKKLDHIRRGTAIPAPLVEPGGPAVFPWENEQDRLAAAEQELQDFGCVPSSFSDEAARAQYEKYRSHAAKNKKQLVRELRAKTQEHYEKANRPKAFSADLGPFGQLNINDDSWSAFGAGIEAVGNIRDAFGLRNLNPDRPAGVLQLTVSMPIFELQCEKASEAIKKAGSRLDGVDFTKPFDSGQEAAAVAALPALIKNQTIRTGANKGKKASQVLGDSAKGDMNPNMLLHFRFAPKKDGNGKQIGSQLDSLHLGEGEELFDREKNEKLGNKKKRFPAQYDKHRTMHYLSNIQDITGISGRSGGSNFFKDMFNPKGSNCSDELAAAFGEGGAAFILKYTLDLDVKPSKKNKLNPFQAWAKENVSDPVKAWSKESKKNLDKTWEKNKKQSTVWGKDELLPLIGEACTIDEIYAEFIDRYNIFSLMCSYLKCLRLPAVNIKAPNFHLPPIPELPVFGLPGINDLVKNFTSMILEILQRALCSLVKMMMDLLSSTTCEEELREAMYGAAANDLSNSPLAEQAFVDAMLDFGVDRNNPGAISAAQDFVEDSSRFLTPQELCRLFQGEPISAEAQTMLLRLAERNPDLTEYLNDQDKILFFFEGLGIFIDPDLCDRLGEYDQVLGAFTCRDTYELLNQQRSRMMSGGQVSDEEIEEALERSRRNLMNKAKAMEIMSAEAGSLDALLPPLTGPEFGNDFPPAMMDLAGRVLNNVFESPKSSYVSSLKKWKPSLFLDIPASPEEGDPGYNSELVMRVERAIENLRRYNKYVDEELDSKMSPNKPLNTVVTALYLLFEEYEKNGHDAITQEIVEGLYPRRTRTIIIEPEKPDTMYLREPVPNTGQVPMALKLQSPRKFETELMWPINLVKVIDDFAQISAPDYFKTSDILAPLDLPYLGMVISSAPGKGLLSESVELKLSIMNRIFDRIKELNDVVVQNIDQMFTTTNKSELLVIIKDVYKLALENARELATVNSWENSLENSDFSELKQSFRMQMGESLVYNPTIELREAQSKSTKDQYVIIVNDEYFLGGEEAFPYCDPVPPEYAEMNSLEFSYAKREVFAQSFLKHMKNGMLPYTEAEPAGSPDDEYYTESLSPTSRLRGFLYSWLYKRSFEGIYEQLFFSLEQSRIWDSRYVNSTASRIEGRAQYDEINKCLNNRFELHHSGIMAFDKMLTENFMKEYQRELQKPENSPELLDYTSPGPMEKAIQNLIVRGFVKICLIELLLKGAIAYPVWDFESIIGDQFFRDFIYKYIDSEFRTTGFFSENRDSLLRTFERITGDSNPDNSLKKILNSELALIPDLSKKIFDNDYEYDYYDWFLSSLSTVSVSNTSLKYDDDLENPPRYTHGLWFHPLSQEIDTEVFDNTANKVYNDPFFYIERYIRVSGPLVVLRELENRAEATYEVLQNLQPELTELYEELNIPLPDLESEEYDYDFEESEFTFLEDWYERKELMSIEDFSRLVEEITPDEKYLYDARGLIFDHRAKGMPMAIKNLPYRPIKRSRKHFTMKRTQGAGGGDAYTLARQIMYGNQKLTEDLIDPNRVNFMRDNQSFNVPRSTRDRYYILPIDGEKSINNGFGVDIHGATGSVRPEPLIRSMYDAQFVDRRPKLQKDMFKMSYSETFHNDANKSYRISFRGIHTKITHKYGQNKSLDISFETPDYMPVGWGTKAAEGSWDGALTGGPPISVLSPEVEINTSTELGREVYDKLTKKLENPPEVPLHPSQLRAEYFSNDYGLLQGESIYREALEKNESEAEHWVESVFDYIDSQSIEYEVMGTTADMAMDVLNKRDFDENSDLSQTVAALFHHYIESVYTNVIFQNIERDPDGFGGDWLTHPHGPEHHPDLGDKTSEHYVNMPIKFFVREDGGIELKFVDSFGSDIKKQSEEELQEFTDNSEIPLGHLQSSSPRSGVNYISLREHGGRINWQQTGADRLYLDFDGTKTTDTIKVPTRIIVTQIKKESSGEILEAYSRTIFPNCISHMSTENMLAQRVDLMERAFIELVNEYISLVDEIYDNFVEVAADIIRLQTGLGQRNYTFQQVVQALNDGNYVSERTVIIPEITNKVELIRRIYPKFPSFVNFGEINPLRDVENAGTMKTQFYSTAKLYEKMCQLEVNSSAFEDAPDSFYSNFSNITLPLDHLFSDPGLLMKNKDKDNLSLVTDKDRTIWASKFWEQDDWIEGPFSSAGHGSGGAWGSNTAFNRNASIFQSGDIEALKTYLLDVETEDADGYFLDITATGTALRGFDDEQAQAAAAREGYLNEQGLYEVYGDENSEEGSVHRHGGMVPRLGYRNEQYKHSIKALYGKRLGAGSGALLEDYVAVLEEEDINKLRDSLWLKNSTNAAGNNAKMDTLTFISALREIQNNQTINYFYQYDIHEMAAEPRHRKFLHISLTNIIEHARKRKENSLWSITKDTSVNAFSNYYPTVIYQPGREDFYRDRRAANRNRLLGDLPIELPPFLSGGSPYVGDNRRTWEEFLKSMQVTRKDRIRTILAPEDGATFIDQDFDTAPPTFRQMNQILDYMLNHEMEVLSELYEKMEGFYQYLDVHKMTKRNSQEEYSGIDGHDLTTPSQIVKDLTSALGIRTIFTRALPNLPASPFYEYGYWKDDVWHQTYYEDFALQAFLLYWSELDYKRDTLAREILIVQKFIENYNEIIAYIDGDLEVEGEEIPWYAGKIKALIKTLMFSQGPNQYNLYIGPWRPEKWDLRDTEVGDYEASINHQLLFRDSYKWDKNLFSNGAIARNAHERNAEYQMELLGKRYIYEKYLSPTRSEMDDYNFFVALNKCLNTAQTEWYNALSMSGVSGLVDNIIASYYDADGNIGSLFRDSKVSQGIRLVLSSPIDTKLKNYEQAYEHQVTDIFKNIRYLIYSQEERSGLMPLAYLEETDSTPRPADAAPDNFPYKLFDSKVKKYFNQSLAFYEQEIELGDCWQLQCFAATFSEFERYMKRKLSQTPDFKTQIEYIFPIRRYMAMATVFSTSVLSGYSTMPSVMNGTKRSFASLYALMENRNDFGSQGALGILGAGNITNSELFNQMMNNVSQNGPNIECFAFPGTNLMDVLEQIGELLKWVVPLLIRGIADKLDPAFREMKGHYLSCNLSEFSWVNPPQGALKEEQKELYGSDTKGSVITFHSEIDGMPDKDDVLWLGLNGDTPNDGETGDYVPVSIAFPVDLTYTTLKTVAGTIKGIAGGGWGTAYSGIKGMGRTIDKFAAYVYSGNLPFLDLNMAFQIPCLDVDYENIADKYSVGTHGRYGHPFTVLTGLAMAMPVLPGTAAARRNICKPPDVPAAEDPPVCDDDE